MIERWSRDRLGSMERIRRYMYDGFGEVKKGPWKADEDEVLINHVNKYGPRDWSSIRSKGLLQRTGKSCRLRWVNKLRPNLKSGVKFSPEEERIVINLQAQFGNKWARISTFLTGRTDNDVKNFWSSRKKRLARIQHTPDASSSNRPHRHKHVYAHVVPALEAPKFSSSSEEDAVPISHHSQPAFYAVPKSLHSQPAYAVPKSNHSQPAYAVKIEPIQMVPLPDLQHYPYEQHSFFPPKMVSKPSLDELSQICFPHILPQFQPDFNLPLENQDMMSSSNLGDPNYLDAAFGQSSSSELGNVQLPLFPACFQSARATIPPKLQKDCIPVTPDSFIDDFPVDIFDHIEPL